MQTPANKPCPSCGGTDRFYLITHPHNGSDPYWRCRICDYTEEYDDESIDDAAPDGRQPTKRARTPEETRAAHIAYTVVAERCAAALWKPEGRAALEYLRKRGLSDPMIKGARLGWSGYSTELMASLWHEDARTWGGDRSFYVYDSPYDGALFGGLRSHFGATKPILKGTITIPYWNGNTCVFLRGRKLAPKPGDPKYLSPTGPAYAGGTPVFYLHHALRDAPAVILTEGEFKALAAHQEWRAGRSELPCVATSGAMYLPPALVDALVGKLVYLAYDNEKPKRGERESAGERAVSRNGAKLRAAGIAVKVIELPRTADQSKTDLDSFILDQRTRAA